LEFNVPLPALTQWVLAWANSVLAGILPILLVIGAILMAAYYESPLRWWLPGLKGIFGTHGRGLILSALGHLVNRSMPLDKAIAWLQTAKAADGTGTRRLTRLSSLLETGMDASKALYQSGLVRQSEAAWLATTPASGRFGSALAELGQSLQALALRRLERRSIIVTTLGTVVVGVVVATTVLAIFTPLIELITWLTP
jgi:general secretion pathway protein F/type IV pilus assembly protein PilC/MSHA biogenesis protein MshG